MTCHTQSRQEAFDIGVLEKPYCKILEITNLTEHY